MSFSLFPKSPKFFDMFLEQNRIIVNAATCLSQMVQDCHDCMDRCQDINRIEAEGDNISRTLAHQLSSTFITPIDREDIHEINVAQETILNHIQSVATRIGVYEFTSVRFPAKRMIYNLKAMVIEIGLMLKELGGRNKVENSVKHAKDLKNECEMLLQSGLSELYEGPSRDVSAILDVMKWTHVYDRIDKAVYRAWGLAKTIEGIVVKNA